uniref:Uncharacterized protein n=1 Tax=Arundo donax TaxID=35708 RepID=A0A0A9C4L0_ARUDO
MRESTGFSSTCIFSLFRLPHTACGTISNHLHVLKAAQGAQQMAQNQTCMVA